MNFTRTVDCPGNFCIISYEVIQMTEKERMIAELVRLLSGRSEREVELISRLVRDYITLVDENKNPGGSSTERVLKNTL